MTKAAALAGAILVSAAMTATAQYRDGQAPTLNAPTPSLNAGEQMAAVAEKFRDRYNAARQPRVALFWNRELTDKVAQRTVQKQSVTGSKSESSTAAGDNNNKQTEKFEHSGSTTVASTEPVDDNAHRDGLDVRSDSLLRTTFTATLRDNGVRLVDRALMVRGAGATDGAGTDPQLLEIKGLQDKAEWLMEVLLVPDKQAAFGYAFRVSVKDVRTETEIADFYTPAVPPSPNSGGWATTQGGAGFQRAAPAAPTVREVGYTLALEVMSQVGSAL